MNEQETGLNHPHVVSRFGVDVFDVVAKYDGKLSTAMVVGVLEMLKNDMMRHGFNETIKVMKDEMPTLPSPN